MDYVRSYTYVFSSPRWFLNMLFELVCQLIPIIGPIVLLGYRYEVIQELHISAGKRYPDFDFNRFMAYATRGLWPFITQMLASLPLTLVFVCMYFIMVAGVFALVDKNNADVVIPIAFGVFFLAVILFSLAIALVLIPAALWAGLAQDFKPGAIWNFLREYWNLVLWDTVLATAVNAVFAVLVAFAGLLLFCVGYIFAIILIVMAQTHLTWQLYELYLERGGTEVPLKLDGE